MSNLPYQIKIFLFIVAAFVNLLAPEIGASKKMDLMSSTIFTLTVKEEQLSVTP